MDPSKNAPPDHPFGGTVSMADPLGSTISMAESPVRSSAALAPSAVVVAGAAHPLPSEARPITGSQPIVNPGVSPAPITGEHGIARPSAPSSPFPAHAAHVGAPASFAAAPSSPFPAGIVPPSGAVSIERPSLPIDHEVSIEIPPPADVEPPSQRPPEAKDPYLGTTFDHRYKIEEVIGEGGMGVVYRARHKVIAKKVAVKVLRADMARDKEILDRFLQEARAASSIGNPHIVDISDFGELPDGSTYIVMEFLEGKSLAAMFEGGKRMPVERICHIAAQIADGLAAAHDAGIVHRDLKPDNIFLINQGTKQDFVKILDFGIAKVTGSANTKLTRAGAVFGTPHYMSPEQAAGAPIDHRTDIYSLGVMLYEMTSGQLPFNADNFMGILTQHMYKAPVPIRALVPAPDCPPGLEAIVLKCLTKRPEGRYATMRDLSADLELAGKGEIPGAVSELMARSGGFNVPHDFFAKSSGSGAGMVPATPATSRTPWPRYVWIAGALTAVALVTLIVMQGAALDASTGTTPEVALTGTATVVAPPTTPVPPVAPAAPKLIPVALAATPESAVAIRDGKTLKLPALIEVEAGKPVTLEVKATGYEPETITIDGKETSRLVKLSPGKGVPGAKPLAPTGKPTGATTGKPSGGSEIVDPWK